MASKNRTFNVKHMGGAVDRKESERVTKDYEYRSEKKLTFLCFFAATNIRNANRTTSKSKTTRNEPGITRTS